MEARTSRMDAATHVIGRTSTARGSAARLLAALLLALPAVLGIAAASAPVVTSPVSVTTLAGKSVQVPASGRRFTLLFFVGYDCPISNYYTPEMNRLAAKYGPMGVAVYAVYPDKDLKPSDARAHSKEYGYAFSCILDSNRALVRLTGASVTPEAFLLSPQGRPLYHGRIDDKYIDFGKARYQATTHDLRDALEAAVHGKPIPVAMTKAIGCYITTN